MAMPTQNTVVETTAIMEIGVSMWTLPQQPLSTGQQHGARNDDGPGSDLVVNAPDNRGNNALGSNRQGSRASPMVRVPRPMPFCMKMGMTMTVPSMVTAMAIMTMTTEMRKSCTPERTQIQQVRFGLAQGTLAVDEQHERDDADDEGDDRRPGSFEQVGNGRECVNDAAEGEGVAG